MEALQGEYLKQKTTVFELGVNSLDQHLEEFWTELVEFECFQLKTMGFAVLDGLTPQHLEEFWTELACLRSSTKDCSYSAMLETLYLLVAGFYLRSFQLRLTKDLWLVLEALF